MPARGPVRRKTTPRPFRKDPATLGIIDAAYRLQKAGSFQQAELLYRRVLMAEPGNPFALCALGTISLHRGDHETAVQQLRAALAQGYDHETVYTHLGIALQALGAESEALEVYRRGLKSDPRNPRYLSNISVILAHQGLPEEALKEVEKAIALDKGFAPAYVNAGFHLQTLGRLQEAARMFDAAMGLDPDNAKVKDALLVLKQKLALQGS
jgi:tetratricopeptide (TPR) repeat protein